MATLIFKSCITFFRFEEELSLGWILFEICQDLTNRITPY